MLPKTRQKKEEEEEEKQEEEEKKKWDYYESPFQSVLKIFIHNFCTISGTISGTINN